MVENSSKPWTSEEEDRLRELVISNAAAFDIAAELWTNRIWASAPVQANRGTPRSSGPGCIPTGESAVRRKLLHPLRDFSQQAILRHMSGNSVDISKRCF